ncbi:MAG: SH3 domain-containing protein [Phaeodactylibacter sp.]|nr:SH3 domain-containing protein [Phaeodactylibacter sp.]MCB9266753.1 SH3 domain-containing protein [Lewinellaceae bacterium]MCB9286623.1 SH3 domain-containing protein [Lewinellaceae bacterium]
MSNKPGLLPKVEILVIGIFFIGFLMWAVSKCNSTRRLYRQQEAFDAAEQAKADSLESLMSEMAPLDTTIQPVNPPEPEVKKERVPVLYVTVNGVNMRTGPGLRFRILERLELYDEVEFLGEVSDTTQEIKLGENLLTNEPWVKVKTQKGNQGWIYGACVDFYKHQLQGVDTE